MESAAHRVSTNHCRNTEYANGATGNARECRAHNFTFSSGDRTDGWGIPGDGERCAFRAGLRDLE